MLVIDKWELIKWQSFSEANEMVKWRSSPSVGAALWAIHMLEDYYLDQCIELKNNQKIPEYQENTQRSEWSIFKIRNENRFKNNTFKMFNILPERGRTFFPSEKIPDKLSNLKWPALNKYTAE